MGSAARICVAAFALGVAAGCQLVGGIDDLELTPGAADASLDVVGPALEGGGTDGARPDSGQPADAPPPPPDGTPASDARPPVDATPPVDARPPPVDAGVDAPTSCPGGYLLCDGFESGQIDTARWQATANDATQSVTVDGTRAFRGSYSLHVHVASLSNGIYVQPHVRESSTFASPVVHMRAYFWISAYPGPDNETLINVDEASGNASAGMGFGQTGHLIGSVSNTPNGMDYSHASATNILPLQSWTCLELMIDNTLAAPNPLGVLSIWQDGGLVNDLTGTADLTPLGVATFGISFTPPSAPPASPAVDLFIDEVAVSNSYIGCEP
jgi:hypothetical protein